MLACPRPSCHNTDDFFDLDDSYARAHAASGHVGRSHVEFPKNAGVLNPNNAARGGWDVVMLVFVVYVLFVTPYELAFVRVVSPRRNAGLYVSDAGVPPNGPGAPRAAPSHLPRS